MINNIKLLRVKFNNLSLRERGVVFFCSIMGLYFILDFFLIQGDVIIKKGYEERVRLANEKISRLKEEEASIMERISNSPKVKNKKTIESIVKKLSDNNKYIDTLSDIFTNINDIDNNLTKIYEKSIGLSIIEFNYINTEIYSGDESDVNKVYKYHFNIHVYGKFHDAVNYIRRIEGDDMHVFFESLRYEVDSYPYANVKIHAFFYLKESAVNAEDVLEVSGG